MQQYRMNRVEFLVLDAEGRLAEGASVRMQQQRHTFELGFVWHKSAGADLASDESSPASGEASAELWRVINAVSLDPVSGWRTLQPTAGEWSAEPLESAMDRAAARGWSIRWGVLIEEDAFGLPEWVVPLRGPALYDAGSAQLSEALSRYGDRLAGLDLLRPVVTAEGLTYLRVDAAMLHAWARQARFKSHAEAVDVGSGPPRFTLRLDHALQGSESFDVLRALDTAVAQRFPIDGFTVSQRFGPRAIRQEDLEPAIRRLAKFGKPLIVAGLEVGGSNAIEAAGNVETVLRTLFAEPMVRGVYFAGLREGEVVDPSAALLDDEGRATASGRVVDRLFAENWWSDETLHSDDLGRASARVFRGDYRVTVTWRDGTEHVFNLRVHGDLVGDREVIVMPIADAGGGGE